MLASGVDVRFRPGRALPPRECDALAVFAAYVDRGSDKAVAHELGVSEATVKHRITRLKERYGAKSRPHLAAILFRRGLLS